MIEQVEIRNYKSITELTLPLGRVNVLIGANGSGKSNILEALAFGSAAANNKLDNEFLASRGIRVPDDPRFMRSAFDKQAVELDVELLFTNDRNEQYSYTLQKNNDQPYSPWARKDSIAHMQVRTRLQNLDGNSFRQQLTETVTKTVMQQLSDSQLLPRLIKAGIEADEIASLTVDYLHLHLLGPADLQQFLVYSPENSALRTFEQEGQIQPLGIRGEGLFKLLRVMSAQDVSGLEEVRKRLLCIDWFSDFEIAGDLSPSERSLRIHDRYLDTTLAFFDQKSANEGFLFLLFYFALFSSRETPSFFAIDNVDASLNPKLCSQLMMELAILAREKEKQVVFTTHNPAILDGLDLTDDQQRLFVVSRNRRGHTRAKRVAAPQSAPGQPPVRLSEAFLRGYLGGLPDNF